MVVVAGVSHHNAPLDIRERFALQPDEVEGVVQELRTLLGIREVAVLNTCNRVEFIAAGEPDREAEMRAALLQYLERRVPGAKPYLFAHTGLSAVGHVFRVAASLDSLVVGEPQIAGQMKQAFANARLLGALGRMLSRLEVATIRTAKRVRTETVLGQGQVSVPSVGVDLAKQIFGELDTRRVALVGSGEMAAAVGQLLEQQGAQTTVVGRNLERAHQLAERVGAEARSLDELPDALRGVDIIITSTSAPGIVLSRDLIAGLLKARRRRSLFIIDLAVPRDVDPAADELDNVFLYNVDDFSKIVAESRASRAAEVSQAERIVMEELRRFTERGEMEQVTPAIAALSSRFQSVMTQELQRSLRTKLQHLGTEDREALTCMVESAVKKLLHAPASTLRRSVSTPDASLGPDMLTAALDELFHDAVQSQLLVSGPRASSIPPSPSPSEPPSVEREAPPRRSKPTGTNGR